MNSERRRKPQSSSFPLHYFFFIPILQLLVLVPMFLQLRAGHAVLE